MRIVFLGASLTEGRYGGNFVAAVARRMPEHEIINLGVGGSTINRILERLDIALEKQPDAAFIMVGSNDAIAYSQPETRPYYKSSQNLSEGFITPDDFTAMYRDLITRLQLTFVQPLVGLPPLEYNREVAQAAQRFNAAARGVAEDYKIPVLDLASHFIPAPVDTIPDRPPLGLKSIFLIGDRVSAGWADYDAAQRSSDFTYTFDGIHITPTTAERFADLITAFLRSTLH